MKRRGVLASLSAGLAGLAGCQGVRDDRPRDAYDVPDTPGTETRERLDPPAELERSVTTRRPPGRRLLLGADPATPVPRGAQFELGFLAPATRESPARLWVGLTNVDDEARTYAFAGPPPLGHHRGVPMRSSDRGDVLLLPADADRTRDLLETHVAQDCWRLTRPIDPPSDRVEVTLPSGGSIAREYVLVRPVDASCPLPDRAVYRFGDVRDPLSFTLAAVDPAVIGPGDSRFTRDPGVLPGYDRTVWYHDTDAPVYLRPSTERLSPGDAAGFALENFSTASFRIDPGGWELYRRSGTGWERVAAGSTGAYTHPVPPGGRHVLSLRVAGDDPIGHGAGATAVVDGLVPGVYALRHGETTASLSPEGPLTVGAADFEWAGATPRTAYAALFAVRQPSVGVDPSAENGG